MTFIKKHPFLFSILVFSIIVATTIITVTVVFFCGVGKKALNFGEKVGIIEVNGVITESRSTLKSLKQFRKNSKIKAIVLRINSPGGAVGPSQEIYAEVKKTKKVKKVVASMGAIAASGGYYIAAAADKIVANPGTITGSIGVLMQFTNIEELLKKIGLTAVVVKSGDYKDIGSPLRKMTPKERKLLQGFVNNIYEQFVSAVAESRKLPLEKVKAVADGRIFSGEEAKRLGLIDTLGNLEDAIDLAARLGGIKGEVSVVYAKEKRFSLFEYVFGSTLSEIIKDLFSQKYTLGYLWQPEKGINNG
nr:signal peptide peptidase SppA [Desulfobacterales bacterium]